MKVFKQYTQASDAGGFGIFNKIFKMFSHDQSFSKIRAIFQKIVWMSSKPYPKTRRLDLESLTLNFAFAEFKNRRNVAQFFIGGFYGSVNVSPIRLPHLKILRLDLRRFA
jgi:hypothetical protein